MRKQLSPANELSRQECQFIRGGLKPVDIIGINHGGGSESASKSESSNYSKWDIFCNMLWVIF